ncbi:DUF445 family protein [Selenomonas artemidis]|uniref:DUF445 family protein n=1 Tax=Selenomonas artemidis TaxID=671224 RepID=UPI00288B5B70|nr:DUF445 family protein [Selenomonas artemidis]
MMRSLNTADRALLLSFLCFLISLYLHLSFPGVVWAGGLLAVSEAALVGGAADWFAVTALFKKPLGFPYHTALLPRRRAGFIHAIVVMVQKEFFSRRKIFRHIEKIHLVPMMQAYLRSPETEEGLTNTVMHFLRASFLRGHNTKMISYLSGRIKNLVLQENIAALIDRIVDTSQKNAWDRSGLVKLAVLLKKEALTEEMWHSIRDALERMEHEKLGDGFLSRLLELTNTVNLEEGASLIQRHICTALDEIAADGSPLQEKALSLCRACLLDLRRDEEILSLARELQVRIADELPIEETLKRLFDQMRRHFEEDRARHVDAVEEHMPELYTHLRSIIRVEYRHMLFLIEQSPDLQKIITKVLYDLLARSALHAQTLVGVIVENVLARLTDDELNRLVYDKVEQDFLWIRVNGSLVGGCIGGLLFIVSYFAV